MTAGAVSAPLIIPIIHLQTHRAKNHIDTNTPVSIQSDTPDVLIFYTVDGSKPVATAVQRGSSGSSRKYTGPILLPAGRVSIRAVAVCSDGRQSSTVTKVFCVDPVDSTNRKENMENFTQRPTEGSSCSPENSAGSSLRPPEQRMMGNGSPPSGSHFLKSPLGSRTTSTAHNVSSQCSQSESSGVLKQLSNTQTSQIHQEINFLRCAECLSFRPSDPFAQFCSQCGAVVPPLPERLPPAEGGQVLCVLCNTLVPVNTQTCLICEANVQQQLQPQARRTLQQVCVGSDPPPIPSADSRKFSCSRCKRMNSSDARYCDWCGSKPGGAASCVMCWRCGASGHPYAFYCAVCGVYLEAPASPASRSDLTQPVRGMAPNQAPASTSHDAIWLTLPSSDSTPSAKVTPPTADQYTQTVGLYYPSATELHKKQKMLQLSLQQATRGRHPLLTAISPGRGFWRKQLDHVCAHLRSYAQNNTPFRTLLGEPRLGRMVSAVLRDDGYEVSLTISFVSATLEEKQVGHEGDGPAGLTETLSSVTKQRANRSSLSEIESDAPIGLMKPPKLNLIPKPLVKDAQLLKELGPGRGQISIIQQLLDQGADPSCCNNDGQHALAVAVVNGHCDVLPVLVQRGADVQQQSGPMKNTALHEAAALGSEGLRCAEVLLSCRAGVRWRNAAGQTAYDVAVSSGYDNMVSLLAAQTGLDLLGRLGKPKVNLDVF